MDSEKRYMTCVKIHINTLILNLGIILKLTSDTSVGNKQIDNFFYLLKDKDDLMLKRQQWTKYKLLILGECYASHTALKYFQENYFIFKMFSNHY